jgi:hypothetical protein
MSRLFGKLEPVATNIPVENDDQRIAISIAVSLKRSADYLEQIRADTHVICERPNQKET